MNKIFEDLEKIELDKKDAKRKEIELYVTERIGILNENLFNGLEKLKIITSYETVKIKYDGKEIFEMDTKFIEKLKSISMSAFDMTVIRYMDGVNIDYDKGKDYYLTVIKDNQWLTASYYESIKILEEN